MSTRSSLGTVEKISRITIGDDGYTASGDLDSGARLCFMGRKHFEEYSLLPKSKKPIPLKWPIKIKVANSRYEYTRSCVIEKVTLELSEGRIVVRNVVLYIVDGPWDDILIGWPVLNALGLTPEQNLKRLVGSEVDLTLADQHLVALDLKAAEQANHTSINTALFEVNERISDVVEAYRVGQITEDDAEQLLQDFGDFWDYTTRNDAGFVITNGESKDTNGISKAVQDAEVECRKVAQEDVGWILSYIDWRDTKPRTKKHYGLGKYGRLHRRLKALQRASRADTIHRTLEHLTSSHSEASREDADKNYKAPFVPALTTSDAKESKILSNSEVPLQHDGSMDDFTFEEHGILEEPEKPDFESYIQKALEEAAQDGCKNLKRLESILRKHRSVFAIDFEDCGISKLAFMEPELKDGVEPCISKPRRMSIEQLRWLEDHINKMVKLGMLRRVDNPVWGVPVFVVKKPNGKGWRMVADFRALNARSRPSTLPMPLLEQQVECTAGAKYFSSLDNMNGFNLLGTHKNELFTLVTPFGCYEMMVAPQGYLNSPVVYQDRIVNQVLSGLHGRTCVNWIDDCLVFGETEEQHLDRLEEVLSRYEEFNVKLSLEKCKFFKKKIVWCGREFSDGKYCFDPKFYDKVLETPPPELATELQDFLFAIQWVQTTLLPFGVLEAKAVLGDFINKIFQAKNAKTRKTRHLVGVKLKDYGWSKKEQEAFEALKQALHKAIYLAVPSSSKELCLFTDASLMGCSIVVTQTSKEELEKPIREQAHEIVFLTTHKWTDTERHWHISSHEAYPVIFALQRLDYLFAGRKVNIFMDHKNLQYIFNPDKDTPKTTLMRLQRWALIIQSQHYHIRHIAGEDNVAADLFSRWGLSQARTSLISQANVSRMLKELEAYNKPGLKLKPVDPHSRRRRNLRFEEAISEVDSDTSNSLQFNLPTTYSEAVVQPSLLEHLISRVDPLVDAAGEEVLYPSLEELKQAQAETETKFGEPDKDGVWRVKGRIWIPDKLVPYVVAVAHSALGHPGANALAHCIQQQFWSPKILHFCRAINNHCLNCIGEHLPRTLRRKLGQQFFATKRNGVLHLDFLYIRKKEYLLTIRDDMTGKEQLFDCSCNDAMSAADGILWWRSMYGLRKDTVIVTDGGSHFANSLIRELTSRLRIRHHITVAYSPWSNGKAERVNREILKLFRVILAELKLDIKDWKLLISQVQFKLNNTPRTRLGGKTSDEVFLASAGDGPLDLLVANKETYSIQPIPLTKPEILAAFETLDQELQSCHSQVIDIQRRLRQKQTSDQEALDFDELQFAIGDWVLISRATRKTDKLQLQWTGPFQVIDSLSPWVYRVRSLVSNVEKNVHVRRIRFYENKYLTITEEIKNQFIRDTKGFELDEIIASRWNSETSEYELKCRWWGFDSDADTWLPYSKVETVYPDKLDRYLVKAKIDPVVKILLKKRNL